MFQDILPHIFDNAFLSAKAAKGDRILYYQSGKVLLKPEAGDYVLPAIDDFAVRQERLSYLFRMDGYNCFLLEDEIGDLKPEMDFYDSQFLRTNKNREVAFAGMVGMQLYNWYSQNRFCGRCAAPLKRSDKERALVCPSCGQIVYPRINPAVITAIIDGDYMLLARGANYGAKFYSLVAGYVEIGESLEGAVARETLEEVGIRVKDITYYASQPWPFSASEMIGFFAKLDGSNELTLDTNEIVDAKWYHRDELPRHPFNISIAGEMIEAFRQGKVGEDFKPIERANMDI